LLSSTSANDTSFFARFRLRDRCCRSTVAPRRSSPTTWNEFLPISMPIAATVGWDCLDIPTPRLRDGGRGWRSKRSTAKRPWPAGRHYGEDDQKRSFGEGGVDHLSASNSGRHSEEQKHCEDEEMYHALKHRRATRAQRDDAEQQRQRQQDLFLRTQPQFERLAQGDRNDGDCGDCEADRCK